MTEKNNLWIGGWWRFTRYEIRGKSIAPAPNASLEWYDPWETYHLSKFDAGITSPYQSLLQLAVFLGAFWDGAERGTWRLDKSLENGSLSPADQQLVLDWCSRFGLLGILPHTANRIELHGRFASSTIRGIEVYRYYFRTNGVWRDDSEWFNYDCTAEEEAEAIKLLNKNDPALGPIVGPLEGYRGHSPRVSFCGRNVGPISRCGDLMIEELEPFFPWDGWDSSDFECPKPLSVEFWKRYVEPIDEFLGYTLAFLAALEPVSTRRPGADLSGLEMLTEPIGISLSFGSEHEVREKWICPSLLSSFGRMAIDDMAAGARLVRCECCNALFVTDRHQSLYCSQACGWKHRKRRARASSLNSTEAQNGKKARKQ
jgi:hypothetical protein